MPGNQTTVVLNSKTYVVMLSCGTPAILEAPNSEASLVIPKCSLGAFLMRTHTDYSELNIPDDECKITAVIEIIHCSSNQHKDKREPGQFEIKIPHWEQNANLWKLVQVRKLTREIEGSKMIPEILLRQEKKQDQGEDKYFTIDQNFITVYTQQPSTVCGTTSEKIGCRNNIRMMLFAKLDSSDQKNLTTIKLKSFLYSRLLALTEFSKVNG